MNQDFARILILLRKEQGLSQKSVANSLGISQALLSHYEKGVRECGLNFVIKCADFYGVSCDYLLGRSAERTGETISIEDIPDSDIEQKKYKNLNIMVTLNRKLISNSLIIIFDMLSKCKNNELIMEISYFLMISIYRIFRMLHMSVKKNNEEMFNLKELISSSYADATMRICEAKSISIIKDKPVDKLTKLGEDKGIFEIQTQALKEEYPTLFSSLLNLIKNSEEKIRETIKFK